MANICYMAVVVDSKEKFDFINKKIDLLKEKYEFEYMGFAFWSGNYIFRFENKWKPDFKIPQFLSKGLDSPIEFWYQETLTGLAGKRTYENGKTTKKSTIDCDIRDIEMRVCLYYTDWEGINWDCACHNKKFSINVTGGSRNPETLIITLRTITENGEIVCAKNYVTEFNPESFNVVFNTFYSEPDKVWEQEKKFYAEIVNS